MSVMPPAAREDQQRDDVGGQADDTHDEHARGLHLRGYQQVVNRLEGHEEPDDGEHARLERGPDDLGATHAPGGAVRGRTRGQLGGRQGHGQAGDVGEHVPGVGQQRQRSGDKGADDLGHQDRGRQAQGDQETTS